MSSLESCEFLEVCEDSEKLEESNRSGITDEDLNDQRAEKCELGRALKEGNLPCLLRDKYSTVSYNKNSISTDKLPDGYYFLRKQYQMINSIRKQYQMINSIRHKKSELNAEMAERLKVGWKNSEMVVESANLEFLNKIYRSKGVN